MKTLVGGPVAEQFMDLAVVNAGTKVLLGDAERLDSMVRPDVLSCQVELRHTALKLAALVGDETRPSPYEKHSAARALVAPLIGKLTKVRDLAAKRSEQLRTDALLAADEQFGPKADKAGLHSEARAWVREQVKAGHLDIVKMTMVADQSCAEIVYHSPSYLLGLVPNVHANLRLEMLETVRPDLFGKLASSADLDATASKLDAVIQKLPHVAYSEATIKQATAKRVEVGA